jgi:adenylate cyclase
MSGEAPESREGQAPISPTAIAQPVPGGTNDGAPHAAVHFHAHHSPIQFRFLEQLKRRNVIRVGILYLVVCWLILEPVHVIFHMLEAPAWANRIVIILMALGLPAVLLFAWVYEITPEGLKPTDEVEPRRSIRTRTAQRLNRAIIVVLSVALAYFAVDKFWLSKHFITEHPATLVASVALHSEPAAPATSDKSVAVLPFLDMSEKKDQEYFSDGLSEELIDMLTKIPDLRVPARTSSFYFKGKQVTISDIAKALSVAHVLEGSVRKSGRTLRITAQLVRADSGYHLWSETYDRQLDDVFKMQDEIAGAVVKALKVSLLEREAPSATLTTSSEAYELYLQAGSLLGRGTSDDALTAYADLQRAVRLDPKFALAWAGLAGLLARDNVDWSRVFKSSDSTSQSSDIDPSQSWAHSDENWSRSWAQARAAAHVAAEQAIKLGPELGESHRAMGGVLASVDWDWAAADAELKKARELEPGNVGIMKFAADLGMNLGRVSEGLQLANYAAAQDPLGTVWRIIGYGQYLTGALDEAQVSLRKMIELYPTATAAHSDYAFVLLARGEPLAALSEFERESAPQFRDVGRPFALDALGRRSEADRAIALAEQKWGNGMAWNIGQFYASRNDSDRAFSWWERAYRQHDGGMINLKMDPICRNLHRDARYKALLRKMNMPE